MQADLATACHRTRRTATVSRGQWCNTTLETNTCVLKIGTKCRKINTTHSPRALLPGRARGAAIPYPGSSLPGVCAIVVAVGSVHKALEMHESMQARITTKRAKTRAGRATQAHDTTLGARGALLQACPVQKWPGGHTWSRDASVSSAKRMGHSVPTWSPPATVQSSWVILCQLEALLQQCKAHGSFCANSKPSCKSAKLMGHSVPTRSPPASVSSAKVAWWTHLESRCKQETQQREQRSERSERLRHTTKQLGALLQAFGARRVPMEPIR